MRLRDQVRLLWVAALVRWIFEIRVTLIRRFSDVLTFLHVKERVDDVFTSESLYWIDRFDVALFVKFHDFLQKSIIEG